MSTSGAQTGNGKAFEYAVAEALQFATLAPIDFNEPAAMRAKVAFYAQPKARQAFLRDAAASAIANIIKHEGSLKKASLLIQFHADGYGAEGYGEDITLICEGRNNIAISCKYNHDDIKHPRLSGADFAAAWDLRDELGRPSAYQNKVAPVFRRLHTIQVTRPDATWSSLKNKVNGYYNPVLEAFADTIRDLNSSRPEHTAVKLHEFCVGKNDFYKVRLDPNRGAIITQAFNMNGTLSPNIPVLGMPSRIASVRTSETNLAAKIVTFDNGTALKFRIHNGDGIIRAAHLKLSVSLHGSIQHITQDVDMIPVPTKMAGI